MIVHSLLAHQIRTLNGFAVHIVRLHTIFNEFAVGLVFLIIPISFGVMKTYVCLPLFIETMVQEELEIGLGIVVRLVVIEVLHTISIGKHIPTGVVASAIGIHLFATGIVPRMISLFRSAKGNKARRCSVAYISRLGVEGIKVCRSAVNISCRAYV